MEAQYPLKANVNWVRILFSVSQDALPGGGALNFFSGRGVRPGFPKCGACELTFASEKGGLWAENFQIWGVVSWKFPNLGACELKISKFGGLWAKIWVKIKAVEAKISKFSQKGSCELTLLLEMGPLRAAGEAWKGGLQGRTSPYPLSRSVPPPPPVLISSLFALAIGFARQGLNLSLYGKKTGYIGEWQEERQREEGDSYTVCLSEIIMRGPCINGRLYVLTIAGYLEF